MLLCVRSLLYVGFKLSRIAAAAAFDSFARCANFVVVVVVSVSVAKAAEAHELTSCTFGCARYSFSQCMK